VGQPAPVAPVILTSSVAFGDTSSIKEEEGVVQSFAGCAHCFAARPGQAPSSSLMEEVAAKRPELVTASRRCGLSQAQRQRGLSILCPQVVAPPPYSPTIPTSCASGS
jgi:hypothetical protein